MAPVLSGGTTVGEALNILENFHLLRQPTGSRPCTTTWRPAGSPSPTATAGWATRPSSDVPTKRCCPRASPTPGLPDQSDRALTSPVAPGDPRHPDAAAPPPAARATTHEGTNTTHLVVADRWGNVVSYTLTIEQTGGSGHHRARTRIPAQQRADRLRLRPAHPGCPDPNLPGPGKRPRSSMSPTIVLEDGQPLLALGSPGGATIITTVLQTLLNRLDLGMTLPQAVAAPRISQRNPAKTEAEPAFLRSPERRELDGWGTGSCSPRRRSLPPGDRSGGRTGVPAARPDLRRWPSRQRRGGGSAMVLKESP